VTAALQEDVQGIAISSYQGGYVEYCKYMVDLLKERRGRHIQVFGGVIVPSEISELQDPGAARIYSPEDGQRMGLAGMVGEMGDAKLVRDLRIVADQRPAPVLGITGTGGAGKSSLTDELIRRLRLDQEDRLRIGVISIDPLPRKSGGALLGDRIRMNAIGPCQQGSRAYIRFLATHEFGSEISAALGDVIAACKAAGFDLVSQWPN